MNIDPRVKQTERSALYIQREMARAVTEFEKKMKEYRKAMKDHDELIEERKNGKGKKSKARKR